ncbi:MAG: helix-turn-helix transcriptional regulator [bacterium]|nr:helix-turn-helix transcriptional regulator [bacterium]
MTQAGLPFHERIRNRRDDRGITGSALAIRAGVSPSYISLIEKGQKVPSEDVAEAIALALDDDPQLYRAWVRTARLGGVDPTLSGVQRLQEISTDPDLSALLISGENIAAGGVDAVRKQTPVRLRRTTLKVPLLEDGADPGIDDIPSRLVRKTVRVDLGLIPDDGWTRPFAYRADPAGVWRVADRIRVGEIVVIDSRARRPTSDRIHAVRHEGRIVLARTLLKDEKLLLLPPEGGSDFEVLSPAAGGHTADLVAGTVAMTFRRWD